MPKKTKEINNTIEHIKEFLSPKKEKKEPKSKSKKTDKKSKKETSASLKKGKVTSKKSTTKEVSKNKLETSKKTLPQIVEKETLQKNTEKKSTKPTIHTFSPEYYDLPYRYNKTVVKILAQTPTNLFVYWEISDDDREKLKEQ